MERPSLPQSLADPHDLFDVAIVGGGITGLTTALLLQKAGQKCVLLEAQTLGFGTTSGTTAHLNTYIDTPSHILEKKFGKEEARLVADGTKEAVALVNRLVSEGRIECDFGYRDGLVFSTTAEETEELEEMARASERAGLPVRFTEESPLPLPFHKCLIFPEQARFHPMKYLYGLAAMFINSGGLILENHRVGEVREYGSHYLLDTNGPDIRARKKVYATHLPPGINLLHFYCAPYRSYVLGVRLRSPEDYPDLLVYDLKEPYHYFRTQRIGDHDYLLVGGADHKTGETANDPFGQLERYVTENLPVRSVDFRWSSQYYVPADGLPYIGQLPGKKGPVYVATGFGGNGITFGSLAGKILSDLIVTGTSPYEKLFRPDRIKPVAGFANFVRENTQVIGHFFGDRIVPEELESLGELAPGEARITTYRGRKLAVCRNNAGEIRALEPQCPHAKCFVQWNDIEKSWDCPCHGSRFSPEGAVLTGPAFTGLKRIDQ